MPKGKHCTCGVGDDLAGGPHEPMCLIEVGYELDEDAYWDNENGRLAKEYGNDV